MVIVCPNLSNKEVKQQFNELVQAVGENAAYQIWSLNNGNPIEQAPNGEPSVLWDQLLEQHNGNRLAAIKDKAMAFADNYVKISQDQNGEVLLKDLYAGVNIGDVQASEKTDISLHTTRVDLYYQQSHKQEVSVRVQQAIQENPNISNPDIIKVEHKASIDWATKRQREIIGDTQKQLMQAFGIIYEGGDYVIPDDNSEIARLRIRFVVDMIERGYIDTYKQNEIDHYIISIGMMHGDATTFNHELAHYYIRRFKNSKLVQTALDMYAKDGMSINQIEEALVDVITERSIQNEWGSNLENQSFFHKFWYGFNSLLYKIFNIKTQEYKNRISDQITKSFLVNKQLEQTENDAKYQLSYDRMFQSEYKTRIQRSETTRYRPIDDKIDKITGTIINSVRSKEKSYSQRIRRNQASIIYTYEQSARNKELNRKVTEFRERIDQARKLKKTDLQEGLRQERQAIMQMCYEFLLNADVESQEMRNMMLNAKANQYKKVYYTTNPNGSLAYKDEQDRQLTEQSSVENLLFSDYTFDDLEYAKTDIIGFFLPIVRAINSNLDVFRKEGYIEEDIVRIEDFLNNSNLLSCLIEVEETWNDALRDKCKDTIDNMISERVDLDQDRKTRLRINMYKWLNDQMDYGDVKYAETLIGMGSRSKSPIIRAMQDIIDQMEDEKGDKTYKIATELMELKRKAEKSMGRKYKWFYNVQKLLMQLDENGLPTGYLLSKINTGKFYRDREQFRDQLLFGTSTNSNWRYNRKSIEQQIKDLRDANGNGIVDSNWQLSIDSDGRLVMPKNSQTEVIYKNYLKEYESWMCEHTERPYTQKYYMDRIDTLSMVTLEALYNINDKINAIKSTCMVEGRPMYNLLTNQQIQNLISLEEERSDLGNFYNADNELKAGDDYKVAYDLMLWNRKTQGKLSYKINKQHYDDCKNGAKDKTFFKRTFSKIQINPEIWKLLKDGKTSTIPQNDPEYQELLTIYYQKAKLVQKFKGEKIGQVKWDQLFNENTGQLKNINFWKVLKAFDERINYLHSRLYDKYKKDKEADNNRLLFGDVLKEQLIPFNYLKQLNVDWSDPNEATQYQHILDALTENWKKARTQEEKQNYLQQAQLLTAFNHSTGVQVPVDIFYATLPINKEFTHKGITYKTLVRTPNSLFQELDVNNSSAEYVNKSYKESKDGFVQPKEQLYKDKRWDVVEQNQDLLNLYNKIKEVMETSWKNLPVSSRYDNRLSQMGARTGQILGRNMKHQFGKNIMEVMRREFSVVETDLEFRPAFDKELRPDGSDIENIPIRFLRKLDKPEYISADLIWSTICFYDMALNFKTKMDHVSQLVSMFRRLDQNQISDEYKTLFDAKQAEVLKGMLDRHIYEKLNTVNKSASDLLNQTDASDEQIIKNKLPRGLNWIRSAAGTSKDWLKRVGKLRISLQLGMLALNLPSAIVSFLDPFISLTADCITGKYVNATDVAFALKELVTDFPTALFGIGSAKAYCKSVAAMQKFQLSRRVPETFRHTDQNQFMRFVSDGILMKGFTLGDYTMNTINIVATMHNYKYYKDSSGTAKFYQKHQFIQKVMQDRNCTAKEAREEYRNAVNMYNCYKVDDTGVFRPDVEGKFKDYANAIDTQTEMFIKKQARSRSAIYNGIVPNTERTLMQTNIILAFFSMLRNFMITGLWERFQTYRDFQVSTFDDEGNPIARESTREERTSARQNQNYYKGGYSFATRQIENAVTWSALYGFRHSATYFKYGVLVAKTRNQGGSQSVVAARYAKMNNINEQDVYGLQKMFLECMCWFMLFGASSLAGRAADDDKNSYYRQLLYLIILRLSVERYTWYDPNTAMELIKSPTTSLADWQRKLKIVALGQDAAIYASNLAGISEGGYNDEVKRGYYQHDPKWKRDLFYVLSSTGIHNWHKSMPESLGGGGARTLRETQNFYKQIRPDWYSWVEDTVFKDDSGDWTEW